MKTTLKVDKELHDKLKFEACKQKIKLEELTDRIFRDYVGNQEMFNEYLKKDQNNE